MITSTTEAPKPLSPLKILLLGDAGTHKTTLALQFPKPHVYDADHNLDGPSRWLRYGVVDPITKKVIIPPLLPNLSFTLDDLRSDDKAATIEIEECYDRLCDKLRLAKTDKDYQARDTHIVDSLSHVNEFIIRRILKLKGKPSMEINLWTDFASAAYTILVARLDDIRKTVIATVHEEKITEADDKNIMKKNITGINPLFSGRVGDSLGAFFTDVWRLEKRAAPGKTEIYLLSYKSKNCDCLKNSIGLPPELDITKGFSALAPYLKGRI